jgi:hypothetical protein
MEASSQFHASAALPTFNRATGTHSVGRWIGPGASLDAVEKAVDRSTVCRDLRHFVLLLSPFKKTPGQVRLRLCSLDTDRVVKYRTEVAVKFTALQGLYYSYCVSGHYPSSCFLFKINVSETILSSSSGGTQLGPIIRTSPCLRTTSPSRVLCYDRRSVGQSVLE